MELQSPFGGLLNWLRSHAAYQLQSLYATLSEMNLQLAHASHCREHQIAATFHSSLVAHDFTPRIQPKEPLLLDVQSPRVVVSPQCPRPAVASHALAVELAIADPLCL